MDEKLSMCAEASKQEAYVFLIKNVQIHKTSGIF